MLDCEYDLNNSDWQNINGDITQRKIRTISKQHIKSVLDTRIGRRN